MIAHTFFTLIFGIFLGWSTAFGADLNLPYSGRLVAEDGNDSLDGGLGTLDNLPLFSHS